MVQEMAHPPQNRSRNASDTQSELQVAHKVAHKVEWTSGILSAAMVVMMIGWVGWEAFTEIETPPEFTIAIKDEATVDGGYRVTFDIANKSPQTAAAVVVRGEIMEGGTAIEDADVTFDYVAGQSKASGAILFSQAPGARSIRLRAVGYTEP
jgi:uncharacterized protein (TIGR02588 family)